MENDESEMFGNYSRKILTDALVNVRQHEICLKTLLHDIINCAKNVENLQIQLAQIQSNQFRQLIPLTPQLHPQSLVRLILPSLKL